eukprot:PhF_6_TR12276/c0_g1_i3/m.19470
MSINWAEIDAKMPTALTPEQKHTRMQLYNQFDPNGNGYLSLAECDKGVRDVLGLGSIFNCKPAIIRAFQAAKNIDQKGKAEKNRDDYIQKCEFRMFLVFLRQYFEMYVMFDRIDTGDDKRVNLEEFRAAIPSLAKWGVKITDVEGEFRKIDKNGGGEILFDEFAEWALAKNLDVEQDN